MQDIISKNILEKLIMNEINKKQQEKIASLTPTEILKNNAGAATSPSANAAAVINSFTTVYGEQDSQEIYNILIQSLQKSLNGENKTIESMLLAQAHSLQSIFSMLASNAGNQKSISKMETCLQLALKAQRQCRTTLETLNNLKKPSTIYANQANISHGHQQVNNNAESDTIAPAVEK
jgi:hypothetical protein